MAPPVHARPVKSPRDRLAQAARPFRSSALEAQSLPRPSLVLGYTWSVDASTLARVYGKPSVAAFFRACSLFSADAVLIYRRVAAMLLWSRAEGGEEVVAYKRAREGDVGRMSRKGRYGGAQEEDVGRRWTYRTSLQHFLCVHPRLRCVHVMHLTLLSLLLSLSRGCVLVICRG